MEPEKKTPEEEKKADAPTAEQKDEPKPEEKPVQNKQTDDNGTAEKRRLRQVKLLWQVVYAVVCGNTRRAVPP